jgi:protein SDA1
LREEDNVGRVECDEDEEAAWQGWDVESESSEESESERWQDVDSGEDNLEITDSEDEQGKVFERKSIEDGTEEPPDPGRVSTLATSKVAFTSMQVLVPSNYRYFQILTPADFAMLNDLQLQAATKAVEAGGGSRAKRKLATLGANKKAILSGQAEDTFISENDILGPRKKAKADYAERIASVEKGREGRDKFGSAKGKKKKDAPSSSTNREKARNKPIMMIMASGAVRGKKKASLRDKQRKLRAHIERAKKSR